MGFNVHINETTSSVKGAGRIAKFDHYEVTCHECGHKRQVGSVSQRWIHALTCKVGRRLAKRFETILRLKRQEDETKHRRPRTV